MISLHFPNLADSPTGRASLRVRYSLERDGGRMVPVLRFAHGTGQLTRSAWEGFSTAGAVLRADSERERRVLREVLGTECLGPWDTVDMDDDARKALFQVWCSGMAAPEEARRVFEGLAPSCVAAREALRQMLPRMSQARIGADEFFQAFRRP